MIFDRSWYNGGGVERVMGFCSMGESDKFLAQVPEVEKAMVESGIILVMYWLEVRADEQTRRIESRIRDPRKVWKLTDMDLKSYSRWYDYARARDAMLAATDTAWTPWYLGHTDDKKRAARHHHAPAVADAVRAAPATQRDTAHQAETGGLPRPRSSVRLDADTLLSQVESATALTSVRLPSGECLTHSSPRWSRRDA